MTSKIDVRQWIPSDGSHVVIPDLPVRSLTFAPNGKLLVLGVGDKDRGEVWLWDVAAGKAAGVLRGHTRPVLALAVSPDGKYLASGGADGLAKLWDIAARRELHSKAVADTLEAVRCPTFTADRRHLVIATGERRGWVRLWEVR